jgi:ribonuclease HII
MVLCCGKSKESPLRLCYLRVMLLPFHHDDLLEAGCDEAGRGCLAGPVFAAAVILPRDFYHPLLNDSKQTTEKQRTLLRPIIEQESLAWSVAKLDAPEIDRINILKASFAAMHRAVTALQQVPAFLLIDGNRFTPYPGIPHLCVIKGDGKYASIAAASILAKTYRDAYMEQLHEAHPQYGWAVNKGYPTKAHREAIRAFGVTEYHRKSFQLLPLGEQLRMF